MWKRTQVSAVGIAVTEPSTPALPVGNVKLDEPAAFVTLPSTWLVRLASAVVADAPKFISPVTIPAVKVAVPLTVGVNPLNVKFLSLLKVTLFNESDEPEIVWCVLPLNTTVPVPALNVPLLVRFPATESVYSSMSRLLPEPIVRFFVDAAAVNAGLLVTHSP